MRRRVQQVVIELRQDRVQEPRLSGVDLLELCRDVIAVPQLSERAVRHLPPIRGHGGRREVGVNYLSPSRQCHRCAMFAVHKVRIAPFKCIDQTFGFWELSSWARRLTKALGAGDGTPGYVGLAGEHPVYRVQIRLATAAAAPVSKYSRSARAVAARRRRTTKRTMAEEDQRKQVSPTVDVMERSARRVAALQTVPCLFCRNLGTFHRFSNAGWSQLLASHLGLAVTLSQLTRPPRPSGQLGTGLNRPTPIKVNLVAQDASVSARIL